MLIAVLVLAGQIDPAEVEQTSEELWQRVSEAINNISLDAGVYRQEALPQTEIPSWQPTIITPIPIPTAPLSTPEPGNERQPEPTFPPPPPIPVRTPDPTCQPTQSATPWTPTPTPTATERPKTCDPRNFRAWWNALSPVTNVSTTPNAKYEQDVCRTRTGAGNYPRRIFLSHPRASGKNTIDADGADFETCRLLECKHSSNAGTSAPNPFHRNAIPIHLQILDELEGYTTSVKDGNPVTGLEICTNESRAISYFKDMITTYGLVLNVNAFVSEREA